MANAVSSIKGSEENLLIQEQLDKKEARKRLIGMIVPYLGLIFIFAFFSIVTKGKFLSPVNLENLVNQSFTLAIIAIGMAFVYAHGGTDMSIGAAVGCGQLACALLIRGGAPLWLALVCCIIAAIASSSIVSTIAQALNVPVFIGSMCVRTSLLGILQFVTIKGDVIIDYQKYAFMNNATIKLAIMIGLFLIGLYLFDYTVCGKYSKAIGGNVITAVQAGVKSKKFVYIAFIFLGFCVGISAIFSLFRLGKVTGTSGSGVEFNIMIAMALGGVPMTGGDKTRIISAIVGAITVTFLVNGLQVWGLDLATINTVKGILFIIIVALSYDRSEGKLIS